LQNLFYLLWQGVIMKKIASIIVVLTFVSLLYAASFNPKNITTAQHASIEKEILKVQEEMKKAAENFDAEALFEHVLDSNDVIIENGLLRHTRKDALDITKQNLQGITELTYSYNHKNISVISSTTALWTGQGTTKIILEDGRNIINNFAESIVFVLQDGRWQVLHAHRSAPN
jgi:hypothetical protein